MIWNMMVLLALIVGPLVCWLLLRSHLREDCERRRLEIHRWALEAEREALKAASMPTLYKGYGKPTGYVAGWKDVGQP